MTPWDGWAQVVHVGGVPWAGSGGDHGDLCAVPLLWSCFPPPQTGTGDGHKQTDLVLETRLLLPCKFLSSLKPALKLKFQ